MFTRAGKGLRSCVCDMRGRRLRAFVWGLVLLAAGCVVIADGLAPARADTLEWAIVQAYQNNPSLNAQRAALRAVDENVPQALSGYRPKLSITANGGYNYFSQLNKAQSSGVVVYDQLNQSLGTRGFGATATETLYDGFQTANRTRQAESQVAGARETSSKFFSTPLLPT